MRLFKERKFFVLIIVFSLLLSQTLVAPVFAQTVASETEATVKERIAGADRYETAAAVSPQ